MEAPSCSAPSAAPPRPGVRSLLAGLALALPCAAQEAIPDQVLVRDPESGDVTSVSGIVTADRLSGVVVSGGREDRRIEAASVMRVELGSAPEAFREAQLLEERGDLANAAAKYKLAATDDEARDVVRALARLAAAEALLRHGAQDPAAHVDADTAATRFLEDFPDNRQVPRARFVRAKAQLLAGNTAKAAEEFRALYREAAGSEPTQGYSPLLCYRAGLHAAEAYLLQEETLAAREIHQALETTLPTVIAALPEGAPDRAELLELQARARLGEGFVLLASGSVSQARSFFQQQDTGDDAHAALRYGTKLGLGLVLLAEGDARRAQVELATVAAVDPTSPDHVARALVGLAEAAMELGDADSQSRARTWLQAVTDQYPESIWVRRAQQLAGKI